jgi:hypothetical protein
MKELVMQLGNRAPACLACARPRFYPSTRKGKRRGGEGRKGREKTTRGVNPRNSEK